MMTKEQNDIEKAEEFGRLPLREHIRLYQEGDNSKLQELLIQSPIEGYAGETQLGFTDYFLNNQLQKMKSKYNGFIAYDEIESHFLWILFHHNNKTDEPNGLFDRVDLEKMNSNRMMNYIAVSIDGYFKTHLESLRTFDDKVVSEDAQEVEDTEEGDEYKDTSLFNQAMFEGWVEVSPPQTPTYEQFLNEIG